MGLNGAKKTDVYVNQIDEKVRSKNFLEIGRKKITDFTRKRSLPFETICGFLLNIVHESLSVAFRRFSEKHGIASVTEQSVSEARNKINWEAFRELFQDTVDIAYSGEYERWNGYRVWAIDGTKIALPNYPALAELFGEEKGSPTARASILYDVLNYTVGDAQLEPLTIDERSMAEEHLTALCEKYHSGKELVIFDRGYPSNDLIHFCVKHNISFLMRVKRKFNVDVDAQNKSDGYVTIGESHVRVVKVILDSGEVETLLTNLEENYDFKQLYFLRWRVEIEYDVIKNTLEIENFSGRTETAIRQDFFIHMLLANILAASYWEAKEAVDRERNTGDNLYIYKPNISQASGAIRDYLILAILTDDLDKRRKYLDSMAKIIKSAVVPIRPNRTVPRKKNPRRSNFHHNQKPNL